jgi:glycosyltransferase involved in cell wall biosynthesis
MKTVLHYKTNFLNSSETFIHRLISNHKKYTPSALCYKKLQFADGLPVFEVPQSGIKKWVNTTAFHLNFSLPFYERTIKELKPDVVHAHFGYDGYKLLHLCEKLDVPLVISFYGSDVSRLPHELFWKNRYRRMANSSARFIAASEYMENQLINLGFPASKIGIVRFGMDLSKLTFKETNPASNRWMMAGRLVEKKGFEYALRAAKILADEGEEFNITIFGDGPLMPKLKALKNELKLGKQLRFEGFQPIQSILAAHKTHGLFIAPSVTASDGDMEGLPNTILEAMALGTPVISTKHAAIPEVIEHAQTGFLTKERDVNQLAKTLRDILHGRYALDSIRQNGRNTVEKLHNVQKMVSDVEHIYSQVIL